MRILYDNNWCSCSSWGGDSLPHFLFSNFWRFHSGLFMSKWKICITTGAWKCTSTTLHKKTFIFRVFAFCLHDRPRVKCLLYKASLHLLLPSMVSFDRAQPVTSPESFCTSYRAGWAETGNAADEGTAWGCFCLWRDGRRQGVCCYKAKLWGYLSHTTSRPTSTPSVCSSVVTVSLIYFHDFSLQIFILFTLSLLFPAVVFLFCSPFTLY